MRPIPAADMIHAKKNSTFAYQAKMNPILSSFLSIEVISRMKINIPSSSELLKLKRAKWYAIAIAVLLAMHVLDDEFKMVYAIIKVKHRTK